MGKRVPEQVARLSKRWTGGQQSRAAHRNDDVVEQTVADNARIFPGAEANAYIDVVAIEIAHLIGDVEAKFDPGLMLAEIVDTPHQPFGRKLRVERNFQERHAARHLLRPRNGPVEQVERIDRSLEQHRACLGQPDGPAGAGKQNDAELILDFLDLVADRRRRQPELIRGPGEIEVPGRRFQRPQCAGSGQQAGQIDLQIKLDDMEKTTRFSFVFQSGMMGAIETPSNRI